jgi:hypothetical protein
LVSTSKYYVQFKVKLSYSRVRPQLIPKAEMIPAHSLEEHLEDINPMAAAVQRENDMALPMASRMCSAPSISPEIGSVRTLSTPAREESTPTVAASVLNAEVHFTDRIIASADPELALHRDTDKVFEEMPTKKSVAVVVTKVVDTNEHGIAAVVPVDAISVHHSMALVASTTSLKFPVMAEQFGAN